MIKQVRYLVMYRDSPESSMKYFGPFSNYQVAQVFRSELPRPLPGGATGVKTLEMFGTGEIGLIKRQIESERKHA